MYKKGKDLKIKGIENLEGMPDYIIYKTDKIEPIEFQNGVRNKTGPCDKPEGFNGW